MEACDARGVVLYHERQKGALCLKHAINNLLQSSHFSKADLDKIANTLPRQGFRIFNPHRCLFLGNYDVNVMMVAFDTLHKDVHWHDERDEDFTRPNLDKCWGLIVNSQGVDQWFSVLAEGRHWHGIKKIQQSWYSLDSVLPYPQLITEHQNADDSEAELRDYLRHLKAEDRSAQVFVITEKEFRR